ncbi:MAG: hypothetical protein IT427_09315 [Pirellulales bacterium]|nr:hypothetical protein [Pirellulales bacterium]
MTPVERLLAKLPDAKPAGKGWAARCPAHEDRRASLSIAEGDDGRALVCCHAGCTVENVCEKVGLRVADLMPPCEPKRRSRPNIVTAPPRVPGEERDDWIRGWLSFQNWKENER